MVWANSLAAVQRRREATKHSSPISFLLNWRSVFHHTQLLAISGSIPLPVPQYCADFVS